VRFKVEFEQEEDGRWIAEVPDLPEVLAYGADRAVAHTEQRRAKGLPNEGMQQTKRGRKKP
jgi:predicted RNase H-like HicB family nuclease